MKINRIYREIIAVAIGIFVLFTVPLLLRNIESLSADFKYMPRFIGGEKKINIELVSAILGYLLRLIPLCMWWISIRVRIMQRGIRIYLLLIHMLMLTFIFNSFMQSFVYDTNLYLLRITGYFIVVVMVYIPLLGFFCAICLGKSIHYLLEHKYLYLFIPATILVIWGLTDELHHMLLYRNEIEGFNLLIRPRMGFYIIFLWVIIFYILRLIIILQKGNNLKRNKMLILFPFLFLILELGLLTGYIQVAFAWQYEIIELPMSYFFFEALTWECMIFSGMIQVNFDHKKVFHLSSIPMELRDYHGNIYDRSKQMQELNQTIWEKLQKVEQLDIEDGYIYKRKKVRGGVLLWKLDVRQLKEYNKRLKKIQEKLIDDEVLACRELKLDEREEKLYIRKQVYTELFNNLYLQIHWLQESIQVLRKECGHIEKCEMILEESKLLARKRRWIAKINIIMVYIKRYIFFYLKQEMGENVLEEDLKICFNELMKILKDVDITLEYSLDIKSELQVNFILASLDIWIWTLEYFDFSIFRMCFILKEKEKNIYFTMDFGVRKQIQICFIKEIEQGLQRYLKENKPEFWKYIQDVEIPYLENKEYIRITLLI